MTISNDESSKLIPTAPHALHHEPDVVLRANDVIAVPVTSSSVPSASMKENSFGVTLCGDYVQKTRRIARRNVYICLCGNHTFDLRQPSFPPDSTISINILKLCGDVRLIVPPQVSVSTCAVLLCGDRRMETVADEESSGSHVKLRLLKLCGNIIVTNEDDDDD